MHDFSPVNINDDGEVLELVNKLKSNGETSVRNFRLYADRNERFVGGDQFQDVNPSSLEIEDAWRPNLPKLTQNHLRNLVNTWTARLLKDRPSVTAYPTSSDPAHRAAADLARKFVEYFEKEIYVDDLLTDVVKTGCKHGTAGLKICFDPTTQAVTWKAVSIFDFVIDPKEKTDDARWVLFNSYEDPYDIKELLEDAGITDAPPVTTYQVNSSEDREGVEVLELWHKPCSKIPGGLYCKIIGTHIVDSRPYPYLLPSIENPEGPPEAILPLVLFKVDHHRGSPYGDTWVSDAIGEQRQINETESTLLRLRRETASVKLIVPTDAIAQAWKTDTSQMIAVPGGPAGIGWVPAPQIPAILFADRDYHFQRLFDIAGLNEQLVGVSSVKSGTSARQIAYLNELDGMKHSGTARSIERMLLSAWRLTLSLVQHYYLDQRLMRIADDTGVQTMAFRGADIAGVSIDLTPRNGYERFPATKAAIAAEDAEKGLIKPAEALEARETGQSTSTFERGMRRRMQEQIKYFLKGATPQVDPEMKAAIAVEELSNAIEIMTGIGAPGYALQILQQLKQAYTERLQQQLQPAPVANQAAQAPQPPVQRPMPQRSLPQVGV